MIGQATILASFLLAAAQVPSPPQKPDDRPAPSQPVLPPYQAKVERLAELMGTLSFMRELCGAADGVLWRDKMAELLAAEGTTETRRDRLAGAFNRGLQEYRITYRRCTASANLVIERSLNEGSKLARDLSVQFGS